MGWTAGAEGAGYGGIEGQGTVTDDVTCAPESDPRPDPTPASDPGADPPLAVGVDVGGSGIKGAVVDLRDGRLASERVRLATPTPATPDAVAATVASVLRRLDDDVGLPAGPVGVTFPAVVRRGVTWSAANVDDAWVGFPAERHLRAATGRDVHLLNDADAAGVAEMAYGAGRGRDGTTMLLTIGTGVGSALFAGGELVPNTELGHLEMDGVEIEAYVADRVRKADALPWDAWSARMNRVLAQLDAWFSVDLFVIGGGVSKAKKWAKVGPALTPDRAVVPATLRNAAGIVGAAYATRHAHRGTLHVDRASG